jgi:hypothetical protein
MEENSVAEEKGEGTPLCIRCCRPVDKLQYYCPHCGEATGQLTQYLPFVNIRWQATVWGRVWRQVWSHNVSFWGRILRLLMIIWQVPIMLIGLLFGVNQKPEQDQPQNDTEADDSEPTRP